MALQARGRETGGRALQSVYKGNKQPMGSHDHGCNTNCAASLETSPTHYIGKRVVLSCLALSLTAYA